VSRSRDEAPGILTSSCEDRKAGADLLAWIEPGVVALLALPLLWPGRFLPLAWHPALVGGLLALQILRQLWRLLVARAQVGPHPLLGWALLFLLAWLPINVAVSLDPVRSWIAAGYLLLGLSLYLALLRWPLLRESASSAIFLPLLPGLALSAIVFLQVRPQTVKVVFLQPLISFLAQLPTGPGWLEFVNPNVLAGGLILLLPYALATLLVSGQSMGLGRFSLASGAALVMLAALLLTQSRGAYMGLAAGVLVMALLRWPRTIYLAPGLLWLLGLGIYLDGAYGLVERLAQATSLASWKERQAIWLRALSALEDFRYTGIGIGAFPEVMARLYPFPASQDAPFPHAHNLFLQIGLDLGLPGLLAYLVLLVGVGTILLRRWRVATDSIQRALVLGTVGGVTAMLVHGLFDATVWGTKLAFLPWLLFALGDKIQCMKLNRNGFVTGV